MKNAIGMTLALSLVAPIHTSAATWRASEAAFESVMSDGRSATQTNAATTLPERPRDEYLYDAKGNQIGLTVHVGSLALTVRSSRDSGLSAGGLAVHKERDADGRDAALIRSDGSAVARFGFARSGRVVSLELSDGMKLSITPQGREKYQESLSIGHGAQKVRESSVSTSTRLRPGDLTLDIVAKQLNLGDSWLTAVTSTRNETGTLTTVLDRANHPLLYIVHQGPDSVAFDNSGRVLFIDVFSDMYRLPPGETEEWSDIQPLVPDHTILTADGRVGAYVSAPAPGAIRSIWEERDAEGKAIYLFSPS